MGNENQAISQVIVTTQATIDENELTSRMAFFSDEGEPFDIGSVGPQGEQGDPGPTATGDNVVLTGLTSGTATAPLATDTVNEAVANLQAEIEVDPTGAEVLLTGMVAGSATAVAATDTVNQAVAKLQAQIDAI